MIVSVCMANFPVGTVFTKQIVQDNCMHLRNKFPTRTVSIRIATVLMYSPNKAFYLRLQNNWIQQKALTYIKNPYKLI